MAVLVHTFTALAAGALALSAAGAAPAQTSYNSYGQSRDVPASCRNVEQQANGYVSAECQTEGGWRWSSLRPVDCRGSISNRDGVLYCSGARATVGPLYPDQPAASQTYAPSQPGGLIGALFGSIFGDAFGSDQAVEQDYSQGRRPLGERRAALEARIDAGVRDGSLSRSEANRLRDGYDDLVRLETRYSADGRITREERTDLRDRYRALSQRVGDASDGGGGDGGWQTGNGRDLEARIAAGERNGSISRAEAARLRDELRDLTRRWADLEARVPARR